MSQLVRILYVDDYPLDRELVRDALEREHGGFELVEAASRADFETALAQGSFDLVLSDFNILGFEGLQVLETVHVQDASLPVIIVTGTGSEEVAAEAIKRGAADYVIKTPRHIQHLPHTIYTVLEKKRLQAERQQVEAALRESERKYRTIIERFAEGFALIDEQGYIVEWNQAMEQIFGVKYNEAVGQLIWDVQYSLLDPEQRTAQVYESLKATLKTLPAGVSNIFGNPTEAAIRTPQSESKIIQHIAFPIELKERRYIAVVVQDITKHKQGEDALREREEIYRTIVDTTTEWIWEMDLSGNHVFSNPQVATILGYRPDEFIGQKAVSFMHEDDRREVESALPRLVAEKQGWRGWILRWRHKDGTYHYLESNASPKFDAAGELVGYIGADRDITERKLAEQVRERLTAQVRKQAQQMEQILATVPTGVFLLDAEWRVMQANPVAEKHLAVLAEVEIGDRLSHLSDHPLGELLTSPPTRGLWHEVKVDGRIFEVIARPVETGSEPEHWVLVINDVTREREVQTQLQRQERLAAVGQLASGIAHDFNNIMAVMMLYTQMLLKMPDLTSKSRERLEIVSGQAMRAVALIQQILDFSRRAVLERCPMDLALFLKEVVKLLERTIPESIKIKLTHEIGEYAVNADPTRLQQAVMNLVINARDAMPEGGELSITLSSGGVTGKAQCVICGQVIEGEWVCIKVTDTGTGISEDTLPYIFDPFFTTKEVGKGTGLGLAQVYGIVAQHEGHIEVTTLVGKGTTFAIYLPALLEQPTETPIPETQALVYGHGETILVVEDDASLREALVAGLELLNYRGLQATNGREALEILEQHEGGIALVLSDMVMPEMGGQALFYALRQRGHTLPVVILSGHPMEKELESLKIQGLAGWMPKPADIEQLSYLMGRVLQEASEQDTVE